MQAQLAKFQSREKDLKDWFSSFNVLKEIDANASIDENLRAASTIVRQLIEERLRKQQETEEAAAAAEIAAQIKAEEERSALQSGTCYMMGRTFFFNSGTSL
jgi:hypothetical protein